jgi:hypothetical protein
VTTLWCPVVVLVPFAFKLLSGVFLRVCGCSGLLFFNSPSTLLLQVTFDKTSAQTRQKQLKKDVKKTTLEQTVTKTTRDGVKYASPEQFAVVPCRVAAFPSTCFHLVDVWSHFQFFPP